MKELQVSFSIERMKLEDVPEVHSADRQCFSTPWPAEAYRREITNPNGNLYIVLRRIGDEQPIREHKQPFLSSLLPFLRESHRTSANPVIGYAGLWIVADEAHITTIGVVPRARGRKLGELLLATLIEYAIDHGAHWVTLETRVSNKVAQSLYQKYTFKESGYRRRYYSDDGEDAMVMWTDRIDTPEFENKFRELKARLYQNLDGALRGVRI